MKRAPVPKIQSFNEVITPDEFKSILNHTFSAMYSRLHVFLKIPTVLVRTG